MREFHISRQVRERYQFDQSLFSFDGNVIFANFHAARLFARSVNQKRDLVTYPERAVKAGSVNGMGLIDEILHLVISVYIRTRRPDLWNDALQRLDSRLGPQAVNATLATFVEQFPPLDVYQNKLSVADYLAGSTGGEPNRQSALEELLLLWITNRNPAFEPFQEFFDDNSLSMNSLYLRVMHELQDYVNEQPHFGPDPQNLVDFLRSPALAEPYSIPGQLEYIRTRWGELLGKFLYRLLSSLDLIKEEEKAIFIGGGPGPIPIPVYAGQGLDGEVERFSPDREWMPRLVLMAKNSYVWLDQLSKKFQRSITRLDQVPDEELDEMAHRGFTGLWLIGLWERSRASAQIKQLCGNPEAIASAYSLFQYSIAGDLGGEEAYQNLRDRALARGIRLASDMVPNHMGIDSPWVAEHPDWFISLNHSPFPSYSFSGPDLSNNPHIGIFLEDHYFSRSDAAVVFKRVDKHSWSEQYIYHGNDGTSMPWNDTAQLNYLKPEVREAVIQTILDVARRFPIIRFDAAMTLAKKHYQRLWYPEPGSGGDIPSRSDFGLSREQFNAAMPEEFWREVVDRVAREVPDTLLLAEAFWLMEGYFVRTLGMHRVYNSAFMNMLRNEDNAQYRTVLKNTLEFEPEIMKRFVNFMNNPDERTAVDQFGKGDKYFGICTLMATLPGLPMFGHGQVEGFTEKYGMEYRRAYWDETADPWLVQRHEQEIFPLLHRRYMFANVENFLLYDFYQISGHVNEDVYAYTNGTDKERALIVYHNRFASTQGWIRLSVGFTSRTRSGERRQTQRSLAEGLNLRSREGTFIIYRDQHSGLEYIRPSQEIAARGLFIELGAYEYHVFLDFRHVADDENGSYAHLCEYLAGRGVPSVEEAIQELFLQPVQVPFRKIANPGFFEYLADCAIQDGLDAVSPAALAECSQKMHDLLTGVAQMSGYTQSLEEIAAAAAAETDLVLSLCALSKRFPIPASKKYEKAFQYIRQGFQSAEGSNRNILLGYIFTHGLGRVAGETGYEGLSSTWLDEWLFARVLEETYQKMGAEPDAARRMINTLRMLTGQQNWYERFGKKSIRAILENWLSDETVRSFLGVNRYQGVLWYNKETFEEFIWWMCILSLLSSEVSSAHITERILAVHDIALRMLKAEKKSAYKVEKLLQALS